MDLAGHVLLYKSTSSQGRNEILFFEGTSDYF